MPTTPRLALPTPVGSDSADVPTDMQELATPLDSAVIYGQGTLASRPVSTLGSPGIQGRIYYATDALVHYWDTGTGWVAIGTVQPGSVGTLELQDNAVTLPKVADAAVGAAELIDGGVTTAKLGDGAVTGAKVNSALKPSQGAGAATEALRALGTVAGMAAAGQHKTQHAPGGADPIDYSVVHLAGTRAAKPAAASANNGLLYFETDTGQLWRSDGGQWVRISGGSTMLTVAQWPASPVDADLILVQWDATRGLVAQFRYNNGSGSSYKWEHIGAGPEYMMGDNAPSNTFTVPRSGEYLAKISAGYKAVNQSDSYAAVLTNTTLSSELMRAEHGIPGGQTSGYTHVHASEGGPTGVKLALVAGHVITFSQTGGHKAGLAVGSIAPIRVS